MSLFWIGIAVCLLATTAVAQEAELLPGELPLELGRPLVGFARLPRLLEIEAAVKSPDVLPLAVFRMQADEQNHYAPAWSADGRSLACLRARAVDKSCKVLVFPNLHEAAPLVLHADTPRSYDHLPAWGSRGHNRLAFSSNRSENPDRGDQNENIFLWTPEGPPRRLTSGPGIKVLPQLDTTATPPRLLFRRVDQFELLGILPQETCPQWNWDRLMKCDCPPPATGWLSPVPHQPAGQTCSSGSWPLRKSRRLPVMPRVEFAIPPGLQTGSGWRGGRSRSPSREWELWTVSLSGKPPAASRASQVRVQEDFRHVGPAWSADSKRIWFTSTQGVQSYYPLRWIAPDGSASGEVHYDRSLTTGIDVAACPSPGHAALAFVAVARRPLDVYIVLLNHP